MNAGPYAVPSVLSSGLKVSGKLHGLLDCYEESQCLMPRFASGLGLDLGCYDASLCLGGPEPILLDLAYILQDSHG